VAAEFGDFDPINPFPGAQVVPFFAIVEFSRLFFLDMFV